MNRIHNRDPELARLFNEYHSKFDKEDIENVAMSLFIMAQEIDGRIRAGHEEALEDEALDSNTQSYLSTFLLAHNLYMQSFQVIEQVTDDMDRASRLYEALSETFRGTPWKALADLSMRDLIFTPEARGALGLAVRAVDVPAVSQTKG